MRKTLSLVLAVLMVLALLPAVMHRTAVAEEASATYTKVTSATDLTDGSYLIVVDSRTFDNAYYAFNGTSSASYNKVDVTFNSSGNIEGNFAANEIEITAVDGGFTLKNSAGKYLSAGNGSNTVVFSDTAVVNAISMNENATVSINMTTDAARELKLNINNDQPFFRYYKVSTNNSNYHLPSLYKKDSATPEPPTPTTFTVKLNPGEHSDGSREEQTVENVTSPYQLPAADYFTAAEGWEFDCWNDGTSDFAAGATATLTADTTFTAKWTEQVIVPTTAMEQVTELNDGDEVVIYYPVDSKVMTGENEYFQHATNPAKNKWQIVAADAALNEGVLAVPEAAAVLTVEVSEEDRALTNIYAFKNAEGKYLYADGTDTMFVERDNDNTANTLFRLVTAEGGFYLMCDSATYNGNPQYLEYYNEHFTCYGMNAGSNAAIFTFQFFAVKDEPITPPTPVTGSTIVLFTNDVHCQVDAVEKVLNDDLTVKNAGAWGYGRVAGLKKALEAAGNDVILVDAGDHIQGGSIGALTQGEAIIDIMNAVGYDLAIPGNHEFDYGMDQFLNVIVPKANYPYISANFMDLTTRGTVFDPYVIIEAGTQKIAFVGLSTPESITKSTPTYFMNADNTEYIYGFCQDAQGDGVVAAAQAAIDEARGQGATKVIVIGHMGIDEQSSPWMSTEIIPRLTGVDAFIDGHSHSVINTTVKDAEDKDVLHGQTGTKLANVGKLTIAPDGTMTMEMLSVDDAVDADPTAQAVIDDINDEFEELLGTVVAHTDHLLTTVDPETISEDWPTRWVRSRETNLGDLCADAYRTKFDADIAFVNGGGVRANIPEGDITFQQIINVHPFGNTGVLVEVTGQQVLDALEMGSRAYPGENGGFLHVAGLTYEIHPEVEANVVIDAEKMWQGPKDASAPYRVQNVKVMNRETGLYEPLDLTKTYKLAGHNYMLLDMGDGFAMFGANNVNLLVDSGIADNKILIDYIQSMPDTDGDGVHEVTGYTNPEGEGRIRIFQEATGDTIVLFTNDVHCGIRDGWGYAGVAELKESLEAAGNEVILVDAGDHIQGGPIGSLTQGTAIIEIMNAVGYDLATLGNHEFDYGMDQLLNVVIPMADYPYVSANFAHYNNDMPQLSVLDGYKMFEANGKKIAFVGLSTPESITKSTPTYFMNEDNSAYIYGFCQDETGALLYNVANSIVRSARNAGADYVIIVGHLGIDEQSSPWTAPEVISHITGADAFIDGHSHTVINTTVKDADNKDVLHGQTGTKLANVGKLTIKADGAMTMEILPASAKVQDDLETDAFIAVIEAGFAELLNTVVAHTDHLLTTVDPETITADWPTRWVRNRETNLGDLCADAYQAMFDSDIAFVNGGGVRANIAAGDITFQQIINVHPFGNTAVLAEVTGQQILDALEMGSRAVPGENGGFLQVAGLTYEIHSYIEPNCVVGSDKMWQGVRDANAPYRVQNVQVFDKEANEYKPLDLEKKYTLAGHNYMLLDMGDGFAMFGPNVNLLIDSGIADNQVLINYIQSMPDTDGDGVHEVTGYVEPEGEGRITIVPENRPTFYGEDLMALDVLEVKDDADLYRYDVKIKNVDEEAEVVGLQAFVAYDEALRFVEAQTNLEGNLGIYDNNGVIGFAWAASGEGITLADGTTIVSLYFELKEPVADGTVLAFPFVASANGLSTGLSYASGDTTVEADNVNTVDGSLTFALPTELTLYGEDVKSLDIALVEGNQRLYAYDICVKNLPECGLYVNSLQIFLEYDADLMTLVKQEGALDFTYGENDNKLFAVWATDSEVLLKNGDVVLTLYFAATADAAGQTAHIRFTKSPINTDSAVSVVFGGKVVDLNTETVDGSIEFLLPTYGDANCDGKITAADAALILRSLVGLDVLTAEGAFNADVDGDLDVTAEDAALILRYIVQLIDQFPVEAPQD